MHQDINARDELIERYRDYTRSVVAHLIQSMNLPSSLFEELIAAGYLGLVEAAERFDPNAGVEFKYFAYYRIRGSVIDSIRECSDLSGRAYRYARALASINDIREDTFVNQKGDISLREIFEFAAKGVLAHRLSFQEVQEEVELLDQGRSPEDLVTDKEQRNLLRELVEQLPEREREVLKGYYFHGKSFTEIAREGTNLSKSWVSRLHARGLELLKEKLQERVDER